MNESELVEEVSGLSGTSLSMLRTRAEKDLYVFCKGILGMPDLNEQLHRPLCRAVESDGVADLDTDRMPDGDRFLRQLFLMSRGHLKSSVITVGDSMRRALSWPEHRIMFGNEVWDNSAAFVGQIKTYLETNELVKLLWPHVIPSRTTGPGVKWSESGLTLVRKGSYREPTFFPIGTGGAVTSKHFTIINLDDLIGLKAFRSPAEMQAAISWNSNIEPLVVKANETIIRWIGTRWMGGDLYDDVMDTYGSSLYIFHRTCYNPDGSLRFPEMITYEFLARLKDKKPEQFAAQYLNDPNSEFTADFDSQKLRTFDFNRRGKVIWIENGETYELDPMDEMDRVMVVDPNSGAATAPDEAAISVTGSGPAPDDFVFSLANWAGRPNPSELADVVVREYRKWRPRTIGVEEAGQQAVIVFLLKERFKKEDLPDVIVSVKPENQNKEVRIRTLLHPIIKESRYFVPQQQVELRSAIKRFPGIKLMDRLDAAAYCVKLLRPSVSKQERDNSRNAVRQILKQRSKYTGY